MKGIFDFQEITMLPLPRRHSLIAETAAVLRQRIEAGEWPLHLPDEVSLPENDKGIENHIPFVNRLVAWWSRMREKGWTNEATSEQRAALKRDLEPIVRIYNEL
jgi:hypothetical protein